ncbi:MAG: hypothetical protein Q7S74_01895 [Nanoarchaeota archaeon]|nr:hypothetical protein [Nanoarchaeota archaeon]
MISFEDVHAKYEEANKYMKLNTRLTLTKENPAHATWLHNDTLARWFYGASKEEYNDYISTAGKFKERTHYQDTNMNEWEFSLKIKLTNMRKSLIQKCAQDKLNGNQETLLMEALSQ